MSSTAFWKLSDRPSMSSGPTTLISWRSIYPYRRHLAGDNELESLRRNLDQIHQNKQSPATSRQDESEDYDQNGDDGENEDSDDDS